jgi:hypothetical protein
MSAANWDDRQAVRRHEKTTQGQGGLVSAKLNAEVTHALSYAKAWTDAHRWPVHAMTLAGRLGVEIVMLETDVEFVARVVASGDDDRVFYCVLDWCPFVAVHGVIAVHCTQRLLRAAGLDAQNYELVARVCFELTSYVADRAAIDWMQKVTQHLRGNVA